MTSLNEIKQKLCQDKPLLQSRYRVSKLGIFGSYVRGEQTEASDIDILVEFESGCRFGLLKFCELENYLSELLGVDVDLVMESSLKPRIGKRILQEVLYL